MTTTATTPASTALATTAPVFTGPERLALAGFLAGYTGLTREAYAQDLRQFAAWCRQHDIRLFGAWRADIECFARDLEARRRARATVTRRLCTIAGFYRYAVEEELLNHSPAVHVRRPFGHACLSTWLNGGVYPTQVAEWAGHSVDVLLRIYAKCVVGQDELAKRRISEALRQD
jgi:hypothetical protein